MENINQSIRNQRRPKGMISPYSINFIHLRSPYVIAMWSAFFPGFGHIALGSYINGFILVIWEIVINMNSKINLAIVYSFQGKFDLVKSILDKRWAFLYISTFIYAIISSYRETVDLNKFSKLAEFEKSPIIPFKMNSIEINYLVKRNPWFSVLCSMFMPGTGHLFTKRFPTGFFILGWIISIAYFSHVLEAAYFSMIGDFGQAISISKPQWLMFIPSIYGFAIYDSYVNTVEYNKLFDIEQSRFLKDNYQSTNFKMP